MRLSDSPLERKRPLLFVIGLLLACTFTLVSFEWRTPYKDIVVIDRPDGPDIEPIWIPVTLPEPNKKAEKPEPPKEPLGETLKITKEPKVEGTAEPVDFAEIEFFQGPEIEVGPEPEVMDENVKPVNWSAVMPEYCEGALALKNFVANQIEYPEIPRSMGVSGVVGVQFIVGKDGRVRDAKVTRSVDPWLDAEALRVAKLLDCFTPGRQAGKAVDVYFLLPVRFVLI